MNCTDPSRVTLYGEYFNRALEAYFGAGPYDNTRIVITHRWLHPIILKQQRSGLESTLRLYNITADPTESNNIAEENMAIVEEIREKIRLLEGKRPYQQPYWMQYDLEREWSKTLVDGDCSMNDKIPQKHCRFTHPWLPDDIDPWRDLDSLTNSVKYADTKGHQVIFPVLAVLAFAIFLVMYCLYANCAMKKSSGLKRE